ncbi:MAG: winged helix-turn-helix transcriptional regulator [Armatimonadetes bacterium]|nr:winged helix-turn-helix transcriptional regulator [Armatimonadota bacterium]
MNDVVLLGKALADPTRVRVLAALLRTELCVCELADAMEMSQSTLSTHLQTLRQAGVLATERRHKWINYSIEQGARPAIEAVLTHYADALKADKRGQRDAERIVRRLAMREDGCCTLGFGQLDTRETP